VLCQIPFTVISGKLSLVFSLLRPPRPTLSSPKNAFSSHLVFGILPSKRSPPVLGRFAMAKPDLDAPASVARSTALTPFGGYLRLCLPSVLIFSISIVGAAQSYAQDQDVAEAARQERARKEKDQAQEQKDQRQKKSKHVYTAEDLKRDHILTPDDRAQVEARKNQPAPVGPQKPQDAIDANSLPENAPLGDVARRLQRQKESQKLQRSTEFHLPSMDAPVLASPKPPAPPLRPFITIIEPTRPPVIGSFHPPVKRSPFERPRILPPALAPRKFAPMISTPRNPVAPSPAPVVPSVSTKTSVVIVKPGDSLWKLAAARLGNGRRWHELLSVNPGLRDPNHIEAGSQIVLPASASPARTPTKYTVRHGDTLWTIAQSQLHHATSWSCIAQANPAVLDANFIHEGQVLLIPASCTR
jgi:nucleoid-associated protein YgaU